MTQALQLLVMAGALAVVVIYGFIRDKQEHNVQPKAKPDDRQAQIYFPDEQEEEQPRHGTAAMSRLS